MARGTAERVKVAGVDALGTLIEGLQASQAIALGALRAGSGSAADREFFANNPERNYRARLATS